MDLVKTISSGNTFLHLERGTIRDLDSKTIQKLCSPLEGLSADGLVVYDCNTNQIFFDIYNRDGSSAELSGNGMAGLSSLLFYKGRSSESITLHTKCGLKKIELLDRPRKDMFHLKVEIGQPDFHCERNFPMIKTGIGKYRFKDIWYHPVSVGNPHIVILVSGQPDSLTLHTLGEELSKSNLFPHGTNVEFVWDINKDSCRAFFYERGVGHTQSSSTGSAAVFAVLDSLKLIGPRLKIENSGKPVFISKKESIRIENYTKILYKITLP